MSATEKQPAPVQPVHTLSQQQYKALEQQLRHLLVIDSSSTPIQAGKALGVEEVLRKLRDGFTVA